MSNGDLLQLIIIVLFSLSIISFGLAFTKKRQIRRKSELMNTLFGELDIQDLRNDLSLTVEKDISFLPMIIGEKYRSVLKEKLSKSGQMGDEYLYSVINRKFAFALFGLIAGFLYFYSSGGYLKALLVGVFGFFLPDILLTNSIQKRSEAIEGALPDAVEMLTMCVEAGLTFQQALGKVSENENSVISTEFARVMSEVQIGESRSSALDSMAKRLNHPDVKKFVSAMQQVDRLGIPISTVLTEQVKELRGKSRDRAREKAQKVPIKILGPLMVCFLPSILIIVIGPVVLQAISAFR